MDPAFNSSSHFPTGRSTPLPDCPNQNHYVNGSSFTVQSSQNSQSDTTIPWIVGTAATDHIICDQKYFTSNVRESSDMVWMADGKLARATHIGSVKLSTDLVLHNVLCIPSFAHNLISVSKLTVSASCYVEFGCNRCVIKTSDTDKVIGFADSVGGVYHFRVNKNEAEFARNRCVVKTSDTDKVIGFAAKVGGLHHFRPNKNEADVVNLWHMRLGHPSPYAMSVLESLIPHFDVKLDEQCSVCPLGKLGRDVSPFSRIVTKRVLELIHCGVRGPWYVPSVNGFRYLFYIVDDFSRNTWTCLMKDVSEAGGRFQSFCAMTKTEFGTRVQMVMSDNSTDIYVEEFFRENEMFMTNVAQEYGVVEHKQQDILDVALAMRLQAKLPIAFEGDCILAAVHIINRIPSPLLNSKSPFELLSCVPPSYMSLKVIGCMCYALNLDKPDAGERCCLFLGYCRKGYYKLYDLSSATSFASRDVVFHEKVFPFELISSQE